MGKKKGKLTQSQINGITCVAVVLATLLILVFFSKDIDSDVSTSDSIRVQNIEILKEKEDSAYHSRFTQNTNYRHHSNRRAHIVETSPNYYSSTPPTPTRKPLMVNINEADTTTLQLLHGIGPTFARRIVRYRERLGGFTNTSQLLEVYGFTPELLNHIASHLSLDTTAIRRIPINSVDLKQFIKHPYVEYYFARDIINLRSRGITFSSPNDLRAIPSCTDSMLSRLLPYLDFKK